MLFYSYAFKTAANAHRSCSVRTSRVKRIFCVAADRFTNDAVLLQERDLFHFGNWFFGALFER